MAELNNPAIPTTLEAITELRAASWKELEEIESELEALENHKTLLKESVNVLRGRIRSLDGALSPFRRIPPDVLEIALHSLPFQPRIALNEAPLSLCQVSSTWRAVMLSSTTMWRELYFSIKDPKEFGRASIRIQEWFKRAGTRPPSFYLHIPFIINKFRTDFLLFMRSIFDSISSSARLALATPDPETCIPYFKDHFHFRRLESLVLKHVETTELPVPYGKGKNKNMKKKDFGTTFCELIVDQEIEILGPSFKRFFPWSQLSTLSIGHPIDLHQFAQILSTCPRLRQGTFCVVSDMPEEGEVEGFHHPVLEELSLLAVWPAGFLMMPSRMVLVAPSLLQLYASPSLKSVRIVTSEDIGYEDHICDGPLIHKGLESLGELVLLGRWHKAFPCARDLLKACVNLRHLEFASCHAKDVPELLQLLTSDTTLLPYLSTLVLYPPSFHRSDTGDGLSDDSDSEIDDNDNDNESEEDGRSMNFGFGDNWYEADTVTKHIVELVKVCCLPNIPPSERLQEIGAVLGILDVTDSDHEEQDFLDELAPYTSTGLRMIIMDAVRDVDPPYDHPTTKRLKEWKV
ncbi:hypothetical protein NLJ89_g2334 [Agrocybe chaxingu]|uniref:F-box domain-containing protein n=1 Tax=Agrocybe chaxingu TaxID=84603 RepID=A0A9W8K6S8_9AGAR|nr:hypothetical protein NLJ89_g2334 [Agrocybe chaxingu]